MAQQVHPHALERSNWLGVWSVALAVFGMVTVEELPIGVLTLMSDDLGTTPGVMALTVTAPGYLAAATALVAPVLAGKVDRRVVLIVALMAMLASSIGSALAPNFATLMASRLILGVSLGGFWTIAPTVAVRLVRPEDVPRATALVFGGGSVATVAGLPIATFAGALLGWRWAFVVVAAVGVANAILLWLLIPRIPATTPADLKAMFGVLRIPLVRVGVILTLVLVTAYFAAYTFASPLLQHRAGVSVGAVSWYLMLAGGCGLAMNFAIAMVVRRSPGVAVVIVCVGMAAAMLVFVPLATTPVLAIPAMMMWGVGGAIAATSQGWINQTAPQTLEAATGWNSSAFNVAIASGAGVGGVIVDRSSDQVLLWTTAAVALCGLLPLAWYWLRYRTRT